MAVQRERTVWAADPFPARLTSFVGRVREMRDVADRLRRHRLVTLVGPGGVGKTRLAIESAQEYALADRWFVDLAMVHGDTAVAAAIAAATGAIEAPGESPLQSAIRRIGDDPALLLVDNCDQVVGSCARVIDALLHSCPALTVLATSRAPLRVEGELVWRVPPLSLPTTDGSLDGDAVLLFLDRSGLAADSVAGEGETIHRICRSLDGMPLAIELAASRAAAIPVADILAGLADRFRLLTRGIVTADRRQQSLAESIRWSYQLLGDDERRVLQRIAVFRGPFAAAAAQVVAAGDGVDARDVLAVLANLVEKSFVVIDERGEQSRYRLLETIREYAATMLAADEADEVATRNRHLRFLADQAELIEPDFDGPNLLAWVYHLEAELADIRAAVEWAAMTGNADDALRLSGALAGFLWLTARADSQRIVENALAIDGGADRLRAKALIAASAAAGARFDPAGAEFGKAAVRIAEAVGDPRLIARACAQLGWALLAPDPDAARPLLERACRLARSAKDHWCLAMALVSLTGTVLGDPPAARRLAAEARELAELNHHQLTAFPADTWLTLIDMQQGRLAAAGETAASALAIAEALGDRIDVTWLEFMLTWRAVLEGDLTGAADRLSEVRRSAEISGNPLFGAYALAAAGLWHYARGELADAARLLGAVLPVISRYPRATTGPYFSALLAEVALASGDVAAAAEHAALAARLAEDAGSGWGRCRAALAEARVLLRRDELADATSAVHEALGLAVRSDDVISTIDAVELIAEIGERHRTPETAARVLGAAQVERDRVRYARTVVGAAAHSDLLTRLAGALGQERCAELLAEGERMPMADAVALVRRRRARRNRPPAGWDALTPAEARVVALVGDGLNNVQIGERLFVSRDTVKGHVSAAFRKLGVTNRTELAAEAVRRAADRQHRETPA